MENGSNNNKEDDKYNVNVYSEQDLEAWSDAVQLKFSEIRPK